MLKVNIENTIKKAILSKGYYLKYEETYPSSPEDMYEIKFWVEDRNLNQFDYKTIYIRNKENPKEEAFKLLLNEYVQSYYSELKSEPSIKELIEKDVESKITNGLKECSMPPVAFDLIKNILEKHGYFLSNEKTCIDDCYELNGWQCDYYCYIWKDDEYTGYVLNGSYYYCDHKIEKDEN